jgi:hypothetical protein
MFQYMHEDSNARYIAIVREVDNDRLAREVSGSRPRRPLLGWLHARLVVRAA